MEQEYEDLTRVRVSASVDHEGVLIIHWTGVTTRILLCISDEENYTYSIADKKGMFSPNIVEFKLKNGWPQALLNHIKEPDF